MTFLCAALALLACLPVLRRIRPSWNYQTNLGAMVCRALEALGGAYPKIGQILSTRADLLPPKVLEPLRRLRSRMQPTPASAAIALLEDSLRTSISEVFCEFDTVPFGVACIAQVHRARLHRDGSVVAVKILRPDIRRRMESDIRLIRLVARTLESLPFYRNIPLLHSANQICDALLRQTDLSHEASSHTQFLADFASDTSIRIPRIYSELGSRDVLIMEYVDSAQSIDSPEVASEDFERLATTTLRALYKMIFQTGLIHSDLHPGNVLVDSQGRPTLIDFGLVFHLHETERSQFARFFLALAVGNTTSAVDTLLATASTIPSDLDRTSLDLQISTLVASTYRQNAGQFLLGSFIHDLFNVLRRHRIKGGSAFTMPIVALGMFEGLVRSRVPHLDFQREAMPFLPL